MKHALTLLLATVVTVFSTKAPAATKHQKPKPVDVAEFLRVLDSELTDLDHALGALQASFNRTATGRTSIPWRQPSSSVQSLAMKVGATVRHYRVASGTRASSSSYRMLKSLELSSLALARDARELRQARTAAKAGTLHHKTTLQAVKVVRHSQNLTDGFAALSCTSPQAYCCVSRTIHEGNLRWQGCRWECRAPEKACRSGLFSGSALPEQSLVP